MKDALRRILATTMAHGGGVIDAAHGAILAGAKAAEAAEEQYFFRTVADAECLAAAKAAPVQAQGVLTDVDLFALAVKHGRADEFNFRERNSSRSVKTAVTVMESSDVAAFARAILAAQAPASDALDAERYQWLTSEHSDCRLRDDRLNQDAWDALIHEGRDRANEAIDAAIAALKGQK